jgi:pilus assembly protein CpaC
MLVLCLLVVAAALVGREAWAQPRELRVAVSAAQVVEFSARSVFIADPTVADIQVSAPTSVIVFGRKPGQTTLIAIGADDKPLANIKIIVGYNYADLRRLIDQDVPNANVKVTETPGGIDLSGVVPNDETAQKVQRRGAALCRR